jgi:hypothetical protein
MWSRRATVYSTLDRWYRGAFTCPIQIPDGLVEEPDGF